MSFQCPLPWLHDLRGIQWGSGDRIAFIGLEHLDESYQVSFCHPWLLIWRCGFYGFIVSPFILPRLHMSTQAHGKRVTAHSDGLIERRTPRLQANLTIGVPPRIKKALRHYSVFFTKYFFWGSYLPLSPPLFFFQQAIVIWLWYKSIDISLIAHLSFLASSCFLHSLNVASFGSSYHWLNVV